MSNIETLIATVKSENLKSRRLHVDTWNVETEMLLNISNILTSIQDGLFTFFDEQRDRFLEQQSDFDAARRAERERLKEARGAGFTTPDSSSDGGEVEPRDGAFSGLGLVGLIAGLGVAAAGYFAGLASALASSLTKVAKGIVGLFRLDKLLPVKTIKAPFVAFVDYFVRLGRAFKDVFSKGGTGQFLKGATTDIFGKFTKTMVSIANTFANINKTLAPVINPIKAGFTAVVNMFKRLGEIVKLFPSGGKFLEGLKLLGAKFGRIFGVFSKIAVPIQAIISTITGIFASVDEFDENTSTLDKIFIVLKNVVKELISGFVTSLLELGKDIISWIAGALGFEGVEKFLDSFDIDAKFREIFDGTMDAIGDFFTYIGDLIYEAKRGLAKYIPGYDGPEVDPEAEARIAQRELDTVDERIATNEAAMRLDPDNQVYKDRQKIYEADRQQKLKTLDEKQSLIDNPRPPSTEETTPPPKKPEPKYQYPVVDPVSQQVVGTYDSAEEAAAAAAPIGAIMGQPMSTNTATAAPSSRPTTLAAAGNNLLPPNVEPVTSLNQVTSRESAERVLSSLTPMLSGDVSSSSITDMLGDNASSTASSVMASALTTMLGGGSSALQATEGDVVTNVTPAGGLATAPVGQASKQVDAAKSQPQVVAVNGGSNQSVINNVANQQTLNMGAMSARSQDLSNQRLTDNMMA